MYKTEFRPYISFTKSVGGLVYSFYSDNIPTNKELEGHIYKYLNMGESPVFSKESNDLINKDILDIEDKFIFNIVETNTIKYKFAFAKLKKFKDYFSKVESYFNIIGYDLHEGNLHKFKSLYEAFFMVNDINSSNMLNHELNDYSRENMKNIISAQLTNNGLPLINITTIELKTNDTHVFLDY